MGGWLSCMCCTQMLDGIWGGELQGVVQTSSTPKMCGTEGMRARSLQHLIVIGVWGGYSGGSKCRKRTWCDCQCMCGTVRYGVLARLEDGPKAG